MALPKKISDRLARNIPKFQEVLRVSKDRDINEADTVSIIKDILSEMFGYDKYVDLTSELAVRSTFCDVAVKVNDKIEFLLEAKAIGISLKENHLKQAVDYGANKGIQWVILSNGLLWELYKIRFEKPINYDLVLSLDFTKLDPKNEEDREKLYALCKEGVVKDAREEFCEKMQTLNKFNLGALLTSEELIAIIRRELRKFSEGVMVEPEAILQVLKNEVIKRDVIEGEQALKAQAQIKRFYAKINRRAQQSSASPRSESDTIETEGHPEQKES